LQKGAKANSAQRREKGRASRRALGRGSRRKGKSVWEETEGEEREEA
jgi:hypothetical protein